MPKYVDTIHRDAECRNINEMPHDPSPEKLWWGCGSSVRQDWETPLLIIRRLQSHSPLCHLQNITAWSWSCFNQLLLCSYGAVSDFHHVHLSASQSSGDDD